MYFAAIQQFVRSLNNLAAILDKAIKYAEGRKFDPNNFVTQRLAPDMLPFARQIQIACDTAKIAGASMTRKEAPAFPDTEVTLTALRERIGKTTAFLNTLKSEDFAHLTDKTPVKLSNPPGKGLLAPEFVFTRALPNFFFHVTTAYALLRAGGVDVGKTDYLGKLNLVDA